jgi:hypothetical protein
MLLKLFKLTQVNFRTHMLIKLSHCLLFILSPAILFTNLTITAQTVENLDFVEKSPTAFAEFLNGSSIGFWDYQGTPTYPGAPTAASSWNDYSFFGGITIPNYEGVYLADPEYPGNYVLIESGLGPPIGSGEAYNDTPAFQVAGTPGFLVEPGNSNYLPYALTSASVLGLTGYIPVNISVNFEPSVVVPESSRWGFMAGLAVILPLLLRRRKHA